MKPKFNIITSIITTMAIAVCCIVPGYAGAQSDIYGNNQQPAVQQQDQQQDGYTDDQYDHEQPQQNVDFNTFYNDLSPYGSWEDDPAYGQVWSCNDPGFTPYYSGGNWAYTDAGWAWNSTYSWGWAPFHYGRWAYRNRWLWVPGYQWAPAWVSWRSGGGYYGWAPLGPGISIGAGFGFGGYIPAGWWNFCRAGYITSPYFSNYCLGRGQNINFLRNTAIINRVGIYGNARFVAGPERGEVERYTGTQINTVALHNVMRPGGNNGFNRGAVNGRQNNYAQSRPVAGQRNNTQQQFNNNRQWDNARPRQNNGYAQPPVTNVQRPQYHAQQYNRQDAYNNRPQYQAQQRQYQPQQNARQPVYNNSRPQYQAPQRSSGGGGGSRAVGYGGSRSGGGNSRDGRR